METQIEGVETVAFQYREVPGGIETDGFEITVEANIQWSDEEELFRAVTEVRIYPDIDLDPHENVPVADLSPNELSKYELCTLVTGVIFEPENYDRLTNGGEPDIPTFMASQMTHIGVETTRGVLAEKIRGTYLGGVSIPKTSIDLIKERLLEQE